MHAKLIKILGLFTIMFLIMGVSSQGPPGDLPDYTIGEDNVQIEYGSFTVRIVGGEEVPFYTFWSTDDNPTKYMVMFDAIFEANDTNNNGRYDLGVDIPIGESYIVLQALSWGFSDVTENVSGVHFDLSSNDGMITLQNHLYKDQGSQLKFDVVVNNYTFTSENCILVFAFKIVVQGGNDTTNQEGDIVRFNDGYFQAEETAQDDEGTIDVGLTTGSEQGNPMIYMSYGQFTGTLIHDPTVGIQVSNDPDEIDIGLLPESIPKGLLVVSTLIASIIAIAIPISLSRRRKR